MVMPPAVTATVESTLPWVPPEPSTVAGRNVTGVGAKGFPSLSHDAQGENVAKISPSITLKSSASDSAFGILNSVGMKLEFIGVSSRSAGQRKLLATGLSWTPSFV